MNRTLLFRTLALAALAAVALLTAQTASADSTGFPVTHIDANYYFSSSYPGTFTETIEDVTVKNTNAKKSGAVDTIEGFTLTSNNHVAGTNPNDKITFDTVPTDRNYIFGEDTQDYDNANSANNCYVGEPLNPTKSCDLALTLTYIVALPTGKGATDMDYGRNNLVVTVTGNQTGGDYSLMALSSPATINGWVELSPEPSSLLLLGTGMLGLAGLVRRKLSRG